MPISRLCSIDGCGKLHYGRGFCLAHYRKWRKYGDPIVGRTHASPGEPLDWLLGHISHQGDDCLFWPFGRTKWGYGELWMDDKHWRAHRLMCQLVHGDPPSSSHEALHSCGNGHLACTNPKHVRWGTSEENSADMIAHGTSCRGENKPNAKLTKNDVLQIRSLLESGLSQRVIATQFNVRQQTVCDIKHRKLWGWL